MTKSNPYAALHHRNYLLYFAANIVGIVGLAIQSLAISWEMYERTHAPLALGLVGIAQFLPVLLLSIPSGHVADKMNKKHLLLASQLLQLSAAIGLAFVSYAHLSTNSIYILLIVSATAQAVWTPVRLSIIADLVPSHDIHNAITWNSSGRQIATIAGPALGGLIIGYTLSAVQAYLMNALCIIIAIGLLPFLDIPRHTSKRVGEQSPFAGLQFIRTQPLILSTITLDLLAILFGGATALLPIYARDILHVGPQGLGLLRSAPAIGALVASMGMAHLPNIRRAGPTFLFALTGFGVATIIFGLSKNMLLSFGMLMATGSLDTINVVIRQTLLQHRTPATLRGRVAAINAIFISSSNDLGAFESGIVAQLTNPIFSVVSGGIGTILSVGAVVLLWPQLWQLKKLQQAENI